MQNKQCKQAMQTSNESTNKQSNAKQAMQNKQCQYKTNNQMQKQK